MIAQDFAIAAGEDRITVRYEPASVVTGAPLFVFAHGAGGHMADRGMNALATLLRACGLDVARFDFPYRARGSRRPDPMKVGSFPRLCITEGEPRARWERHSGSPHGHLR